MIKFKKREVVLITIAIEGASGVGKSTFADCIYKELLSTNLKVFHIQGMESFTHENPINELIKKYIFKHDRFIRMPFWAESYLLLANMFYNNELIARDSYDIVLRENYIDAFRVFQEARLQEAEAGSDISKILIRSLTGFSNVLKADLTYLIIAGKEKINSNLQNRTRDKHLLYTENDRKLQSRIQENYLYFLNNRENLKVIKNDSTVESLFVNGQKEAKYIIDNYETLNQNKRLIYIAGPLFSPSERSFLEEIDGKLIGEGYETYLPHRDGGLANYLDRENTKKFYNSDVEAIYNSEAILSILNGADVDSGTSWEIGFAYALGKPIFGLYQDTRNMDLNLMIKNSVQIESSTDMLITRINSYFRK